MASGLSFSLLTRDYIADALKDESINNYDVMAPKGKSLAFKEFMAGETEDGHISPRRRINKHLVTSLH